MARKRIPPPPPPPGILSFASPLDRLLQSDRKQWTIFDRYDPPTRYSRNMDCWADPIDLTCLSAWNGHMGNREPATLISSRHVAMAWHYPVPVGTGIAFVGDFSLEDGNAFVTFRTLVGTKRMGKSDLLVGYLDEPVAASIRPALLLKTQEDRQRFVGTPVLYTNQKKEVHVAELTSFGIGVQVKKSLSNKLRAPFFKSLITYDSGNPIMLLSESGPDGTDLRPVLIAHYSTTGGGVSYEYYFDALMETMAALGPEQPKLVKQV
jgi:hypothetical protein